MPEPIEQHPAYPLPLEYRPPLSKPYIVKDKDTWESVALRNNLDVQDLIYYNFQTINPDEVNWYLRRKVGCNVKSPTGLNWAFSSSAKPGVIWLPVHKNDLKPRKPAKKKIDSPIALEFEGPSSPFDFLSKVFDGWTALEIGHAAAKLAAGEAAIFGAGIVATLASTFVILGGLAEGAVTELKKQQMLAGLSLGIVIAADGRSLQWVKAHNGYDAYVKTQKVRNVHYPEYGKELADLYNKSFFAGYQHGAQFSEAAHKNLFQALGSQMSASTKANYQGQQAKDWSDRKWADWYRLCAAILARQIILK